MKDKIQTKVLQIITEEAKIDFGEKIDKSLLNFRWDSLQHIKIIIAIEKKFKVRISTSDIGKLNNAKSIISYLKKK